MPFPVAVYRSYRAHQTETGRGGLCGQIQRALKQLGYEVIRHHPTTPDRRRLAATGTPDLQVVAPRCWGEVKTPEGRLSPAQIAWHEAARARGERVFVWRSIQQAIVDVQRCEQEDYTRATAGR
jgi:hypothetical protein